MPAPPSPNPHDTLFRFAFGDPAHAEGQLRAVLPAALVPVIVAHAAGGWRATTRFEDLVDFDGDLAELAPHVPRFSYLVDDLTRASDRELLARTATAFARVVWVTLKHARGDLMGALHRVVALLREIDAAPHGPAVLGALLQYLCTSDTTPRRRCGWRAKSAQEQRPWRRAQRRS